MTRMIILFISVAATGFHMPASSAGKGWSSIFQMSRAAKSGIDLSRTTRNVYQTQNIYDQTTLTPEQLLACLKSEQEISKSQDRLEGDQARIKRDDENVKRLILEINLAKSELLVYQQRAQLSPSLAEIYNQKVDAYNNQVRDYRATFSIASSFSAEFNTRVDSHNNSLAQFNRSCSGRKYFDDDLARALAILGK